MIMKTLQNNFTTPEQSKQLLELSVPADSADCYLTRFGIDEDWEVKVLNNVKYSEIAISNQEYCLPCWSVGRLMEIFDMCYQREPEECIIEHWILTQEAAENFGSYIEYLVQTFSVQKNYLDFSKLEE